MRAACSADSIVTPEPIDRPAPSRQPILMNARIDGFVYTATAGAGFEVPGVEVNKGGVRLSATFANTGGNLTAPLTSQDFELRVAGSATGGEFPARVEYTSYDAFSGSLYWIAPGQSVPVYIGLFQKSRGDFVFGPHRVTITRREH